MSNDEIGELQMGYVRFLLQKFLEMQPWGIRVLYLSDPTGVLWHIVESPNSDISKRSVNFATVDAS